MYKIFKTKYFGGIELVIAYAKFNSPPYYNQFKSFSMRLILGK